MSSRVAIIIGNGTSRLDIDLNSLIGKGEIFGCNAIYRDFDHCDYIVAIDDGMIEELSNADIRNSTVIIPMENERWEDAEYSPHRRRSNAGMTAMKLALKKGYDILYCIGFDFILKGDISVDNVYKNTPNYGPETHANKSDNYYRIKYLEWFARQHVGSKFIFVVPEGCELNPVDANNIQGMTIKNFNSKL